MDNYLALECCEEPFQDKFRAFGRGLARGDVGKELWPLVPVGCGVAQVPVSTLLTFQACANEHGPGNSVKLTGDRMKGLRVVPMRLEDPEADWRRVKRRRTAQ